ncbi:hypothetical protein FTV88_3156 [Heliorestis convoluta]|uniref:Uncharacterized protein n=1 Tax=Heliorestis convoluta TaxID=356322 RepID=A0A5Q2NAD4_9FIRM|nr:hypothetical protein FTV88_3156 [Heliorestis convoluta]
MCIDGVNTEKEKEKREKLIKVFSLFLFRKGLNTEVLSPGAQQNRPHCVLYF